MFVKPERNIYEIGENMRIICLVKFVPDVDKFKFDFTNHTVDRQNVRMIINPDDACGVGYALGIKSLDPTTQVEVVTMGPKSITPMVNDLVRVGVDQVHMISDTCFGGSDSYITSLILGTYLRRLDFNCIVTGTHAIDGDTSHVPSQIGDYLNIGQMSNIIKVKDIDDSRAIIVVEDELSIRTYNMNMPGIISVNKDSKYKMPYIKKQNMDMDVSKFIKVISNEDLNIPKDKLGVKGSLTKVNRTFVKEYGLRDKTLVTNDQEGIDSVYRFLKNHGYIDRQGVV